VTETNESPAGLIGRARAGDAAARGELLGLYQNYLRVLARAQLDRSLRVRVDESDLVQETMLEALRDFAQFAGSSEGELVGWLRRILVRNLADQVKRHRARARDWHRQESLEALLDRSCQAAHDALARDISTPSAQAARREQAVLLADALARLPADYVRVIVLRNVERLRFDEVAARMGRSCGAVRMLWARALERLGEELGKRP
jgi:RNA polymerase sigma-70 factor (ECF subfamily)